MRDLCRKQNLQVSFAIFACKLYSVNVFLTTSDDINVKIKQFTERFVMF